MSATLSAYRNALRATRVAFRGDLPILHAARTKIKENIIDKAQLQDPTEIEEAVKQLNEVSKFLISNIVQGQKQQDGKYFLNFHEKTELGDNETIKQGKKEMGSLAGKKGSSIKSCRD
ncbi:Mitochondrial zinc maintenance protein 1, mitochondrial [Candida viswanathii]|uniref:Mitochondrial zinc maintenance protein 1, mitochondrial n=1 Tax=Candida viswanathii TaxID=5486 RepID=A0A367YPR0_9ASCO|nr:Mitochondrial zinc maintenance protein 1, mitochondrial [Candida viswanathii]